MTTAAFQATYAEWRVIKTRATVQLVFELPIERADEAYQALGGMPIAAHEVWCGIARLDPSKDKALRGDASSAPVETPRPAQMDKPAPVGEVKSRRAFDTMAPSQQAGILCNEMSFQKYLKENHRRLWDTSIAGVDDNSEDWGRDAAAIAVRRLCKVMSRSNITPDNADWSALVLAYRLWQREPEFIPA